MRAAGSSADAYERELGRNSELDPATAADQCGARGLITSSQPANKHSVSGERSAAAATATDPG